MKNFLKKSNIYLMKIQISFVCKKKKKIRSAFNENTNQFLELKKKIRSVFNESTNQFCV